MPRSVKKRRHRSKKQYTAIQKAQKNSITRQRTPFHEIHNNLLPPSPSKVIHKLECHISLLKTQAEKTKQRYWNERRKNGRWKKTSVHHCLHQKKTNAETYKLRGIIESLRKRLEGVERDSAEAIGQLNEKVARLEEIKKGLNRSRTILQKRCHLLQAAKAALKRRMTEKQKQRPYTFKMMKKRCYTPQVRSLARVMVAAGAAEAKVGAALVEIGRTLGVDMEKQMSRRAVGRCVLELGVAADLQLVYEILKSGSEFLSFHMLSVLNVCNKILHTAPTQPHIDTLNMNVAPLRSKSWTT